MLRSKQMNMHARASKHEALFHIKREFNVFWGVMSLSAFAYCIFSEHQSKHRLISALIWTPVLKREHSNQFSITFQQGWLQNKGKKKPCHFMLMFKIQRADPWSHSNVWILYFHIMHCIDDIRWLPAIWCCLSTHPHLIRFFFLPRTPNVIRILRTVL